MTKTLDDTTDMIISRLSALECRLLQSISGAAHPSTNVADLVDLELNLRRERDRAFPTGYFADTAWELLLELYRARQSGQRYSISDLGLPANIPATTTLRYVEKLVLDGFAERHPDPTDRRRVFIRLSDFGASTLNQLFAGLIQHAAEKKNANSAGAHADEISNFKEFRGTSVFI